jgi:uncharacterized protein (DUF885 family)
MVIRAGRAARPFRSLLGQPRLYVGRLLATAASLALIDGMMTKAWQLPALLLAFYGCASLPLSASVGGPELERIYADYWEESMQANPVWATLTGDHRFNDRTGEPSATLSRAAARALAERYLARVAEANTEALSPIERTSLELFQSSLQEELEGLRFPRHLMPLSQLFSPHLFFAQLGSGQGAQPFREVRDYENWIARASAWAAGFRPMMEDLRTGMATGVVLPKPLAAAVVGQLERMAAMEVESSVFMGPIRRMPESVPPEEWNRLTGAFRALVSETILPIYRQLHQFMRNEYLPAARDSVAWSELPSGEEWYAFLSRIQTSTTLTPQEIHQIGLNEVERIEAEMKRAMKATGFAGELPEFYAKLKSDPDLHFTSAEEMLAAYESIRERVEPRLAQLFGRMPRTPYEIRPVESFRESNAPPAEYSPGEPDGSRPGVFYLNTYRPTTRPRYIAEALFLHEAIPGHHFESSLKREQEGLPTFRRFSGSTAYSEGWGLYAERLGWELGCYQDPYQWVGRLTLEVWRAVRLVVDTGLHAKGWSREQAIEYMVTHVPMEREVLVGEIDRYIAMPAQALAYKIGELKLIELRERAERELGPRFDLRGFHDEVLSLGSVPLPLVEAAVERWIAARR